MSGGGRRFAVVALAIALAAGLAAGCEGGRDAPDAPGARAASAAAPPAVDAPAAGAASIPARFRGSYATDVLACERPGDPSQLEITAGTLAFHESRGEVLQVAEDAGALAVVAAFTGEGEAWEATFRLALSPEGRVLTDLDGGLERVRCD